MVSHLAAVVDDFFVLNDRGERVFKIDCRALRMHNTLRFCDLRGNSLCAVHSHPVHIRNSMEIQGPGGEQLALIQKDRITPLRDHFTVKLDNGPDLHVRGNILAHEYNIGNIATVSRSWFRIRDSYCVEIAPGQNDVLVLAATACIDQMTNDMR